MIADFRTFEGMVEATIDLEAAEKHEYVVSSSFSPDLAQKQEEKQDLLEQIEALVTDVSGQNKQKTT